MVFFKQAPSEIPTATMLLDAMLVREARAASEMERLEMIGDCFLKFGATVWLFYNPPEGGQLGDLTVARSNRVCNAALTRTCIDLGLEKYICTSLFHPSTHFIPPMFHLDTTKVNAAGGALIPLPRCVFAHHLHWFNLSRLLRLTRARAASYPIFD